MFETDRMPALSLSAPEGLEANLTCGASCCWRRCCTRRVRRRSLASSSSRATALNTGGGGGGGGAAAAAAKRRCFYGAPTAAQLIWREGGGGGGGRHRSIHSLLKISDTPFDFPHNTWPLSLPGMAEKGRSRLGQEIELQDANYF